MEFFRKMGCRKMRKIVGLFMLFLLAVLPMAQAENWYEMGRNNGSIFYIDMDSFKDYPLKKEPGMIAASYRGKVDLEDGSMLIGIYEYKIQPIQKGLLGNFYPPKAEGTRMRVLARYDKEGNLLEEHSTDADEPWRAVETITPDPLMYWYIAKAFEMGGSKETIRYSYD